MKKLSLLFVCFVTAFISFAQTEMAKNMYAEATSEKTTVSQYLKQDFSKVDSASMHDLAVLFYRSGDYVSAGTCWEIALGKVKKHGKAYEQIINCLTTVYMENSDYEKLQWLMPIIEEHNRQELLKECNDYKCKLERAQYHLLQGDEVKAKEHIKESFELCETEEQRVEVEETYAGILFDIRDFEGAAQYYYSAANRWYTIGNIEKYGNAMYWSAQNYILSSKYDVAENLARKAVEVSKDDISEKGRKSYINHLVCLGTSLFCQQKYKEALEIYTIELDECKKSFPGTEKHADALEDIGKVLVRLKQFDEAKLYLEQACNMYKELNLDNEYSNTYSELLICMRKSGDDETADAMETEADNRRKAVLQGILDTELSELETIEKYLNSTVYTNSLNTIAGCYYGLDMYMDAAHYWGLYTENLREMLQEKFLLLTDIDRERVWKEQQQHIDDFRYNVATLPDANLISSFIPTLYDMELLSKGIMLNSVIEFEKVLENNPNKELLKIYSAIKENLKQIDELQTVVSDDNIQQVLELKQTNTSLQHQLMIGCATYNDYTKYLSYTWQDVQAKLGDNDIAIEFTTVHLSPLDKDIYILALILASTGEPTMEIISTKAFIKYLKKQENLYDDSQYFDLIWGCMQPHLAGKERVYFASDNSLSDIAIEYLYDGNQTFFKKYETYRLSSTKELCRNYSEPASKKTIAIFGDIDYNTQAIGDKRGLLSFGQLKYSKQEIDDIKSAMSKYYKVSVYDKDEATEQRFRELSDNCPEILHISSHGDYAGNDQTSDADAMNNSFLALSGINGLFSDDILNDGKITAADISQMNLRQCNLAVLSACNTGLGGKGVDGIFGLQRGFKNAGVRSLLMSINPVYDESTAKLMTVFYEGISQGKSKRQSLLDAQNAIKAMDGKKGKDWASFILLDGIR